MLNLHAPFVLWEWEIVHVRRVAIGLQYLIPSKSITGGAPSPIYPLENHGHSFPQRQNAYPVVPVHLVVNVCSKALASIVLIDRCLVTSLITACATLRIDSISNNNKGGAQGQGGHGGHRRY